MFIRRTRQKTAVSYPCCFAFAHAPRCSRVGPMSSFRLALRLTLVSLETTERSTERAIQHEDFSSGQTMNYKFTRIRVMFPDGFDVCDSVIGVQGNMSGVTIRKSGSNQTRQLRFYKAASSTSTLRAISEPSIAVQKAQSPIPRTGVFEMCYPRVPFSPWIPQTNILCCCRCWLFSFASVDI